MSLFGATDIGLFILAGLLLNITPGADLLYITNRSAIQGKKAGVIAALGIGAGCIAHVLAAAFGLSIILVSSSFAFTAVKYLGAAYLFYLGIKTLLTLQQKNKAEIKALNVLPLTTIFRQAILINILNPKVALFFMALLPQFVSPTAPNPPLTFLFLGLLFNVNGTLVNIVFALFTSLLATKLKSITILPRLLQSLVGSLFIALGVRLAITS
jgi:threonine/homoserine/homoserine lactone efflux protein